ncbi:MAG: hypothetical protein WBK28_00305 [Minisyncoccia bacterium]
MKKKSAKVLLEKGDVTPTAHTDFAYWTYGARTMPAPHLDEIDENGEAYEQFAPLDRYFSH